ncbi:unnamed protein product, partial [Ectocarpus sp. 8 AP-2014]
VLTGGLDQVAGSERSRVEMEVSPTEEEEDMAVKEESPRSERRPSLRHLKNRLREQDDFSSGGEEEDGMSSSDEEQIDSGGGVAAFYRESSTTAGISASTAQASDELNVLDSFDLPKEDLQEKVIESFSCGLYSGGLPLHGRLYVTGKYALFSGWRNTKVVVLLSGVVGVEKTSTLRFVPNALTLVKSRGGEKVTLGSFLFRDDCHALLLRLVKVSGSIS